MFTAIRIWHHKRRARYWLSRIEQLFDIYDCGADLIDTVTGGKLTRYRGLVNEHRAMLQRIDPNYPKK